MSILAAAATTVIAAPAPPQITWVPDSNLQVWSTRLAFVIALIWIVYLIAQFVVPGKRGGGLGRGGAVKFIGAAFVIIMLMDLKLLPTVINNALSIVYYLFDMVGIRS